MDVDQFRILDKFYKDRIDDHFKTVLSKIDNLKLPMLSESTLMDIYRILNDATDDVTGTLKGMNYTWELTDCVINNTKHGDHRFYFEVELKPRVIRKGNLFWTAKLEKYPRTPNEVFDKPTPTDVSVSRYGRDTIIIAIDVDNYSKSDVYIKWQKFKEQIIQDRETLWDAYLKWKEAYLQDDEKYLSCYVPYTISDEEDIISVLNEHMYHVQEVLDDIGRLSNSQCNINTTDSS